MEEKRKEVVRKRYPYYPQPIDKARQFKIAFVIILFSAIIGRLLLYYSNYIQQTAKMASTMDIMEEYKKKAAEQYKQQYGEDWKSKLKEKYADQLNQMDDETKRKMYEQYKNKMQ